MESQVKEVLEKIKRKEISSADDAVSTAAEAVMRLAETSRAKTPKELIDEVEAFCLELIRARPTSAAIKTYVKFLRKNALNEELSLQELKARVAKASKTFIQSVEDARRRIAVIGARRLKDGATLLTHGLSRTVYAILEEAVSRGKHLQVYVTEGRPKFEGRRMARLLGELGIPVALIVDSAARLYIEHMDAVLVGAEAIASNGAVMSKVGTSMIAAVAYESRVRVMVAAGTHKFSPETIVGGLVEMEVGDPSEVLPPELAKNMRNVRALNPLYDATPPEYIDLIITEEGVIPPQAVYLMLSQGVGLHGSKAP